MMGLTAPLIGFGEGLTTFLSGFNPKGEKAGFSDYVDASVGIVSFGLSTVVGKSGGSKGVGTECLLQNAADQAIAIVGKGKGPQYGTKVHNEFKNIQVEGTTSEVSYKDGQVVPYGTKGSVRVDRVVGDIYNPSEIWDLKTGNAKVCPKDVTRYQQNVPNNLILKQLKPSN